MPSFIDRLRPHSGPALLRKSGQHLADTRAQLERVKNGMARIDQERTRLHAEREELAGNPGAATRLSEIDRDLQGLDVGEAWLRDALAGCEKWLASLEEAQREAEGIRLK